jgi:mannose-1-phosphate guanylyltransferase
VKAVVLVGGQGTRLRPLTETVKKELLPLVDRPILDHTLDRLVRHGVHEVVLSSSYLEETFHAFIQARHGDPSITWITEAEPLDTGGAIVNALPALDTGEPFLALNGDILTDLDVTRMLALHRDRGAVATIALTHVEDARAYGLVPLDGDGRVLEFREKPADLVPGDINAGTYVLEPSALEVWERGVSVSIERTIFPSLIEDGRPLFGFVSDAYWMDLGTPQAYLQATFDLLDGKVGGEPAIAAPFVAQGGRIDDGADVDRHVVVGPGSRIEGGSSVTGSVLHGDVRVADGARVTGSVVGPGSQILGARVSNSVLGERVRVRSGAELVDARVEPGTTVP